MRHSWGGKKEEKNSPYGRKRQSRLVRRILKKIKNWPRESLVGKTPGDRNKKKREEPRKTHLEAYGWLELREKHRGKKSEEHPELKKHKIGEGNRLKKKNWGK